MLLTVAYLPAKLPAVCVFVFFVLFLRAVINLLVLFGLSVQWHIVFTYSILLPRDAL